MRDPLVRVLIVLVALLLGAVVVLIGITLSGDGDEGVETGSTVMLDPGAGTAGSAATTGDRSDIPLVTVESGDPEAPDGGGEGADESPPGDLLAPAPPEVWRETYTLTVGDLINIPVPSETALTQIQLQEAGFSLNKEWWFVGTRYVGPEGCRDSTRPDPFQPVAIEALAVTEGWFACIDVDRFARFGQMHFLDVDPAGLVTVEVIMWDFAAIGDEGS